MRPTRYFILTVVLGLAGCGGSGEERTAADVRTMYADMFIEGVDFGLSGRITARAIDPITKNLLDVNIEEINSKILHANRGELIVDTNADTISIRLVGVTSADTESGVLTTVPMFLTEAIELDFDVIE